MPIYEYKCGKCGSSVEVIQKLSDQPLKRCKKCRGKLEKIVSRASFQLKGSGWYKTDYSNKGARSGADSSDKTPDTDKTPEKKPEAKPSKPAAGDRD